MRGVIGVVYERHRAKHAMCNSLKTGVCVPCYFVLCSVCRLLLCSLFAFELLISSHPSFAPHSLMLDVLPRPGAAVLLACCCSCCFPYRMCAVLHLDSVEDAMLYWFGRNNLCDRQPLGLHRLLFLLGQ